MSIDSIREKLDDIDFDKWTEPEKKRQLRHKEFEEIRNTAFKKLWIFFGKFVTVLRMCFCLRYNNISMKED